MRRFQLFVLLLLLMLSACSTRDRSAEMAPDAALDNIPNLVGEYAVNGFDPLGQEYGGRLTITDGDQPGTYNMQWIIVGSIQDGTGVLKGNQLLIEWQSVAGSTSQSCGTAIFTITETIHLIYIKPQSIHIIIFAKLDNLFSDKLMIPGVYAH